MMASLPAGSIFDFGATVLNNGVTPFNSGNEAEFEEITVIDFERRNALKNRMLGKILELADPMGALRIAFFPGCAGQLPGAIPQVLGIIGDLMQLNNPRPAIGQLLNQGEVIVLQYLRLFRAVEQKNDCLRASQGFRLLRPIDCEHRGGFGRLLQQIKKHRTAGDVIVLALLVEIRAGNQYDLRLFRVRGQFLDRNFSRP